MSGQCLTSTFNGAVALKSTGNPLVDFFMLFSRSISEENIDKYMKLCWKHDPIKTIAIIFNGRDRKNGKKEKKVSNDAMIWFRTYKQDIYKLIIDKYVEKYGCWKDVMYIALNRRKFSNSEQIFNVVSLLEYKMIANQLIVDKYNLDNDENISLCAKWAPSENDKYDRRKKSAHFIAKIIFPNEKKNLMEKYRKLYLTPLRNKIKTVESQMCDNKWSEIKYETVPAIASTRLKNAFMKHDPAGYSKYLADVKSGDKKINVTGILPHELVNHYLLDTRYLYNKNTKHEINETVEMQWKTIVEEVKKSGALNGLIPIVDVSGSMFEKNNGIMPVQVSIALGILIAECSTGFYNNKIITFCDTPELVTIRGDTLYEKVKYVSNINAGTSTNYEATSDLIIDFGLKNKISQEDMPKKLVCLTDMQFNEANINCNKEYGCSIETLHKHIIKKYEYNNYRAPKFIYWNLNAKNDEIYPVSSSEEGTAIISGFSEQLLKVFMKYDDFNPEFILNEILEPYIKDITTITDIKDICDFYKNDINDNTDDTGDNPDDAGDNTDDNNTYINKTLTLGDMMRQYFYKQSPDTI